MGEMIRLKCNDCGNSYDLMIGQGMLDSDLETVKGHFDPKAVSEIEAGLASYKEDAIWSYRQMIGYCSSCRSITSVPTFHIFNKGEEIITAGTCECGHIPVLTDDNDEQAMRHIKCPVCNSPMKPEITGMWD